MRRVLFACLAVALVAVVVHSIKSPILLAVARPHAGYPIVSIGQVFGRF
ncbi:hypothetical protein SAMN05216272_109192 [Pseudomonas panipatensis]|uniref:Uncharacterized protein n=1 Tax=Pseudomonas panipatensis TaxID=428992 RepID=A0A1G8KQJ2_9PSED|nr:hypothetical protein SAMN05216272_109192 [Pseudomonas panipatensis]SMP70380.1 hypothetical protein SAMN06295951_109192 [Pseudomonas panipatensis]